MSEHKIHHMQQTSLKAFEEIQEVISERHEEIYNALLKLEEELGDATDQEIKQFLNKLDANYVRPRRNNSPILIQEKTQELENKRIKRTTNKNRSRSKMLF